jgi:hypothetical protein
MMTKWKCPKCGLEQHDSDRVTEAKCRICGRWTELKNFRQKEKCTCGFEECPFCGDEY